MNLYKNGYVVSEIKDNDYTHNVWPLEDRIADDIAASLTDEAPLLQGDGSASTSKD